MTTNLSEGIRPHVSRKRRPVLRQMLGPLCVLISAIAATAAPVTSHSDPPGAVSVFKALEAKAMVEVSWPTRWQVFGPLPAQAARVAPGQLTSVPASLEVDGKSYKPVAFEAAPLPPPTGKTATAPAPLGGRAVMVNLAKAWSKDLGPKERQTVYAFGEFDCPSDGTLYVNCGADWWMQWFIDGKPVYDTLDGGNRIVPAVIEKRGFSVDLVKGKHVAVAMVQSGSGGFCFGSLGALATGPAEQAQKFFEPWKTITIPEKYSTLLEKVDTLEPAPVVNDTEADRIIAKVRAPPRFADYKPAFRVRQEKYLDATSISRHEYTEQVCYIILDGDRQVGSMKQWAGCVDVSFSNMNPLQPWNGKDEEEGREARRYCRLLMGVPLRIDSIPSKARFMYAIAPDGQSINIQQVMTPEESHKDAWTIHRMRATIRIDPQCGYVCDATEEFLAEKTPSGLWTPRKDQAGRAHSGEFEGTEFCNVLPSHVIHFVTYGPYLWRYERTLYTPRDSDKFIGWINDTTQASSSDNAGLAMRKDGFICFAVDKQGWSQILSRNSPDNAIFDNATCWKLQDQHNNVRFPKPDPTGPCKARLTFRFMNIPPEATAYLLDRVEMMGFAYDTIMVRQGQTRDFESDAREAESASPWTAGVKATGEQAHGGAKSALLKPAAADRTARTAGVTQVRLDPLPVLKVNATYRLEAWVKIKGEGSKIWLSTDPAHWTPRPWDQPALTAIESNAAEKSDEWQKLTVTFTTPPSHGRTPQLWFKAKFNAPDSAAYLDDVSIVPVRDPAGGIDP